MGPEPLAEVHRELVGGLVTLVAAPGQRLLQDGQQRVVLGAGRLGLLVTRIAVSFGVRVIAVTRSKSNRELALRFGATEALDAGSPVLGDLIRDRTDGLGATVVVECTGHPDGLGLAVSLARPGGTVALKSTPGVPSRGFDVTEAVVKEITLTGSRCGPFDKAIDRLSAGRIPVDDFVAGVYPLEDIEAALEAARRSAKILIEFPEPEEEECEHHH